MRGVKNIFPHICIFEEFRIDGTFVIRIPFKFPHHVTIHVYDYKKNSCKNILTSISSRNKLLLLDKKGLYNRNWLPCLNKFVMKIPGLQNVIYFSFLIVQK